MGKPSLTRVTKSSTTTISSTISKKMNAPMSSTKLRKIKKRNRSKKKKNIRRLFDNLKNQSNVSIVNISSCTDSDFDVTAVNNKTRKRKHSVDDTKVDGTQLDTTLILVDDDEENAVTESTSTLTPKRRCNLPPVICSTPNSNDENGALQELNVSDVSRVKVDNNVDVQNLNCDLTKVINRDSYLTIDLTTERTSNNFDNTMQNTVIDLEKTCETQDCVFVSCSNASLSLSGESDVTVLQNTNKSNKKRMKDIANCVAKLNAEDKGELLDIITQKIFNGCAMPKRVKDMIRSRGNTSSQATNTLEDTYIKDVIVGKKLSRNSIGSNIYNPEHDMKNKTGLRMIVIDGSNVAMQHARGKGFSVKGLKICIDYFLSRGHVVKAFVPQFRCKYGKSTEPQLLSSLERRGLVVFTPSREIQGRMVASYDDRYIVQCAAEFDGVIVSGDNYRDLLKENPRWRFVIENRLLQFTWVNDMIMFPSDPLGRNGPTLEQFLKHSPQSNINV